MQLWSLIASDSMDGPVVLYIIIEKFLKQTFSQNKMYSHYK